MTEAEFLASYDPEAFARPSVTVDLVLLGIVDGQLKALLRRRDDYPAKGKWALPGSFVAIDEGLESAARRILAGEARIVREVYLEQLYTFGAPARDPRMRIITVAYYALLPTAILTEALDLADDLVLADIVAEPVIEQVGTVELRDPKGATLPLAFDHGDIIATALQRLRGKLDYAPIAFALLPERFTLRALQDVHEAILGTSLNKPAFRRRMLDTGWIEGTGKRDTGGAFRPAELFRYRGKARRGRR